MDSGLLSHMATNRYLSAGSNSGSLISSVKAILDNNLQPAVFPTDGQFLQVSHTRPAISRLGAVGTGRHIAIITEMSIAHPADILPYSTITRFVRQGHTWMADVIIPPVIPSGPSLGGWMSVSGTCFRPCLPSRQHTAACSETVADPTITS